MSTEGERRGGAAGAIGLAIALLAVGWAALAYFGFGPNLAGEHGPWWAPRGSLAGFAAGLPLPDTQGAVIAIGAVPALLLTIAVFFTTRSAVARFLAVSSTVAAACFAYYGLWSAGVWRFFGGHWSGTMAVFSLIVGGALCAVLLARSWRRQHVAVQLLLYLPIFAVAVLLERNITGTNHQMAFAISPWPAVQVFGLETIATAIFFVIAGVGAGLFVFAKGFSRFGRYGALLAGTLVGVLLAPAAMWAGAQFDLLPFQAGNALMLGVAILSALVLLLASARLVGQPAGLAQRARIYLAGAILLGLPLLVGQALTRWDYTATRDDRAQRIIDALAAHYAEHEAYPEDLEELVAAGRIDMLPEPRIGFAAFPTQDGFVYQNFGMSYLLEFAAPRWIQCAYNPPYADDDYEYDEDYGEDDPEEEDDDADYEDDYAGEEDGDLAGAWSCPSKPPELW